ncbi:peroxidase-like [Centruroides vittatus]|uniref:peroxidase-like n=1 Tax=Centruroides vittatus TaxID=120091 RepID=UPI00350EB541
MYFNVALSLALGVFFVSAHEIEELFSLIDGDYLQELVRNAELEVQKLREIESKAKYLNPYVISAEGRHQLKTCPAYHSNDVQTMFEIMTRDIVDRYDLDPTDINLLREYPLKDNEITRQLSERCVDIRPVECTDTEYPTIDGSCNHLDRPNEGRTFSCLDRLLPPDYADGVDTPRICRECPTPDPRNITLNVHRTAINDGSLSYRYTAMVSIFGQFIDHDMEFTSQPTTANNSGIQCCGDPPLHETCFPIEIPPNDPDFPDITCLNFVRDARCETCRLGWREQMNSLTPAIDCSQVYDTELDRSLELRTSDGTGKLASRMTSVGEFPLPDLNLNSSNQCNPPSQCFKTGDFRSNQNLGLAAMHITSLRYHNRIAEEMKIINPQWTGETLFRETRKLVICVFQKVVYTEFLPLIVGPDLARILNDGGYSRYDPSVPMKLINSFAAAGYRLHSIVPDPIFLITEDGRKSEIPLRDSFFNVTTILQRGIEDIIRGATIQAEENYDDLLVQSLTTFMYRRNTSSLGLDLASINIQRGREHGLPPYIRWVRYFHGFAIDTFSDLITYGLMDSSIVEKLQTVYQCVECIDLFTGLTCERRQRYSVVGPTAAQLIARQFYRLKFGARHFYTHTNYLTSDQRAAIEEYTSLSHIFCYANRMAEIAETPFIRGSRIIRCSDLPRLDLSAWKED